jgi:hypothetical protein
VPAGTGGCTIEGLQSRKGGGPQGASFGLDVEGSFPEGNLPETSGSTMAPFFSKTIAGLGGHTVKPFFEYQATAAPTTAEGSWLDDITLWCNAPLSAQPTYAFEQGTSMATPHVTGAAALLFSLKPTATVTQVREALLTTTTPTPSLAGKTVTGGRLDVNAALNKLVPPGTETTFPDTELQTSTPAVTAETTAKFHARRVDADGGTFECSQSATGAFSPCANEIEALGLALGEHTLRVRAKNQAGIVDPTPATFTWTITSIIITPGEVETGTLPPEAVAKEEEAIIKASPPGTPAPPPTTSPATCTVPKLAGKTLGAAKAALRAARCKLGKVTSPKVPRGSKPPKVVVKITTPGAGSRTTGTVAIKLAAKPKRHHH